MTDVKKSLQELIQEVSDNIEKELLIVPELMPDRSDEPIEVVKTGSKDLDDALGIGGLPVGRIVEILGENGSGKTTLASHVMANAQNSGHKCAFIDVEYAFDKVRAEQLGVKFDQLAIAQPSTAEDALQLLDTLIVSGIFKVIVLDSVAALIPKAELEGEMSDSVIGLQARLMGKIMRKIVGTTSKNKVLVIFTNQLRDKIGGFNPMPTKVGSGGNALKFYSSVRLDLRRTKNEKRGEKLIYTHHKITITKNKLGIPFKVVQVKIGEGGFINESK